MYFEDYVLGEEFEISPVTMQQEELISFARDFDPRPFHLEKSEAQKTRFGRLFASGFHTLCLCWGAWVKTKIDEEGMIAGIGLDELRWKKPVFAGDKLFPRVKIEALKPSSDGKKGAVTFKMTVNNQEGEEVLSLLGTGLVASKDAAK